MYLLFFFFFFQAEDGIRDYKVTGVQTCALPIYRKRQRLAWVPHLLLGRCRPVLHGAGLRPLSADARQRWRARRCSNRLSQDRGADDGERDERSVAIAPGARGRSEERRVGKRV